MAKDKKLTVTCPNGQVITRRTPRSYVFAVVSRVRSAATLRGESLARIAGEERQIAQYEAVIRKQGHADYQYVDYRGVTRGEPERKWIADCRARIAREQARDFEAEAADPNFFASWHSRRDLADTEALHRREAGCQDVTVVPVNNPA